MYVGFHLRGVTMFKRMYFWIFCGVAAAPIMLLAPTAGAGPGGPGPPGDLDDPGGVGGGPLGEILDILQEVLDTVLMILDLLL
jgi:hypothetical protein